MSKQNVGDLVVELVGLWPYQLDRIATEMIDHAYEVVSQAEHQPSDEIRACYDILHTSSSHTKSQYITKLIGQIEEWAKDRDNARADNHFAGAVAGALKLGPRMEAKDEAELLVNVCAWAAAAVDSVTWPTVGGIGTPTPYNERDWQRERLQELIAEAKQKLDNPSSRLRNSLLTS